MLHTLRVCTLHISRGKVLAVLDVLRFWNIKHLQITVPTDTERAEAPHGGHIQHKYTALIIGRTCAMW